MTDKRQTKLVSIVLGSAAVLAGCASGGDGQMSMEKKAKQAVVDAKAALQETRSETDDWGTWKSTIGMMRSAQKSLDEGNYKVAIQGAEEVEFQAEQGLAQYREEQDQWKKAVSAASQGGNFLEAEWVSGQGSDS